MLFRSMDIQFSCKSNSCLYEVTEFVVKSQPTSLCLWSLDLFHSLSVRLAVVMSLSGLPYVSDLPRDEEDSRFVKSFDCKDSAGTASAVEFFNQFGFVVLESIFDATDCVTTRNAMWSILETANPEFDHSDQSTWSTLKSKGNYGLSTRGPSFHPTLVNNRFVYHR